MAYKITDACISCGACEAECPVSAISEGNGNHAKPPLPSHSLASSHATPF